MFVAALYPLARIVLLGVTDGLGANPIEFITRATGHWTLVLPVHHAGDDAAAAPDRLEWLLRAAPRCSGCYAFFYAVLHFTTFLWFDQFFDVAAILKDIVKRPFITVGFAAFLLLIPLAVTSPNAMVKRLGRQALAVAAPAHLPDRATRRSCISGG